MPSELTVGQKLYCVYSNSRFKEPREVEITKVGRKWIELSNNSRIDKETLWLDGGKYKSPGRCYLSKDLYEAERKLEKEWRRTQRYISEYYHRPTHISLEDIEELQRILGIT